MKNNTISIAILIGCLLLGTLIMYWGSKLIGNVIIYNEEQRSVAECEKWIDWDLVYPDFFLTQWQWDQCSHYGVTIDTKILK